MMKSASYLALLALLLVDKANADPISVNAFMPMANVEALTHDHPAFGGIPSPKMVQPLVVTLDGTTTSDMLVNTTRRLEASTNTDIQRLESFFGQSLTKNLDSLTSQYKTASIATAPWPGSYWPIYMDSINYPWYPGEPSAAEKYAKAFGLDVTAFKNKISQVNGVESCSWCQSCTDDNQCTNGDACAKRQGASTGKCIAKWWGICHAWAPAAILEPEGKCSVTKNGVTFRVGDIKALMTLLYDGASVPVVFTGARYDGDTNPLDSYGRYKDAAERDLGPGFFHIAVTNILGRFKQSFIVDVTASAPVWNQPVRSYEVLQVTKMKPRDAMNTFFSRPNTDYTFNPSAVQVAYVKMAFHYIVEWGQDGPLVSTGLVNSATDTRTYEYLLELDSQSNIIGGEWVYGSRQDHPDFLWLSTGKPKAGTTTAVNLNYDKISDLLKQSVNCGSTDSPPPPPPPSDSCGSDATGATACPDGQYCQPWNPTQYQCRSVPTKCGKQETGVDYYGDDLKTVQLLLPEQCCDECFKTPGCQAYTFINYNPDGKAYCYLKKGTGTRQSKVGAVSAKIQAPACTAREWDSCGTPATGAQCCPSGDYCQPWDVNFFQCIPKPAKCSTLSPQTDFYGNDIKTVYGGSPWDCCEECSKTAGCKAYTFVNDNPNTPACYLKYGTGTPKFHTTAVSATLN